MVFLVNPSTEAERAQLTPPGIPWPHTAAFIPQSLVHCGALPGTSSQVCVWGKPTCRVFRSNCSISHPPGCSEHGFYRNKYLHMQVSQVKARPLEDDLGVRWEGPASGKLWWACSLLDHILTLFIDKPFLHTKLSPKPPSMYLQNALFTVMGFYTALLLTKGATFQPEKGTVGPCSWHLLALTVFPHHPEAPSLIDLP